MTSQQIVAHAKDQELRERVAAILVDETRKKKALAPQTDPTPDVIEYRLVWAAEWFDKTEVTDANIVGVVRSLWPPAPAPEPPVGE